MAIQLHLQDVNLQISRREDGACLVTLLDPQSAISVHFAMPEEIVGEVVGALTSDSGIVRATPADLRHLGNGNGNGGS